MKKIKFICAILVGMTFSASSMKSNKSGDSNDKVGETISTDVESLKSNPKGSKERTFLIECIPYFCLLILPILALLSIPFGIVSFSKAFDLFPVVFQVILHNILPRMSFYMGDFFAKPRDRLKLSYVMREFLAFMITLLLLYALLSDDMKNKIDTIKMPKRLEDNHEKFIKSFGKPLGKLIFWSVIEMFFFVPKIIVDHLYPKNDSVSDKSTKTCEIIPPAERIGLIRVEKEAVGL